MSKTAGGGGGNAKVEAVGQVTQSIEALRAWINSLDEAYDNLNARLTSITTAPSPMQDPEVDESVVGLALDLQRARAQVQGVAERISDLAQRLEL